MPESEREDRMIEQLIAGTRHSDLQKKLLGKDKSLTLQEAIRLGRNEEASIQHMNQ